MTLSRARRLFVLSLLVASIGCSDSGAATTGSPAGSGKPGPTGSGPKPGASGATSAAAVDRGAEADAVLKAWLAAQNGGDHPGYMALYGAGFKGVRRTADGTEKSLDLEGWGKDRERLFKNKQEVAADNVVKKVEGDKVTLTFIQRWKSAKSADHGEKVIDLAVVDGKLRIVREELQWSERGWEDSKEKPLDATALVSPITLTVERVRLPDNGDCSETRLRLHLVDSKGEKKDVDYGTITGMGGGATPAGGKLTPKSGEYSDLGVYCAGLQQGYTVKVAGDTIVALSVWMDEESGPGKDSKVVVTLPRGASVETK